MSGPPFIAALADGPFLLGEMDKPVQKKESGPLVQENHESYLQKRPDGMNYLVFFKMFI